MKASSDLLCDRKTPVIYWWFSRCHDKFSAAHIVAKQPLATYKQIPSDLSQVTTSSHVGVASTEQADGNHSVSWHR